MAIKHQAQRVAILIDTQNLYHSAKHLYKRNVNFGNIVKDTVLGRQLIRAYAYAVSTEEGTESSFFEALTNNGIEIRTKDLQVFAGGAKKGDWDVGIAIDAVELSEKVDAIILVSGDGDFVPMIQYLQGRGCQAEVASFGKSTSQKLIESADDFIDLDKNAKRYLLGGPSWKK